VGAQPVRGYGGIASAQLGGDAVQLDRAARLAASAARVPAQRAL